MKIALFGATGKTGRLILGKALPLGLEITALARNPAKLDIQDSLLHVMKGDALNADDVAQAIQGQDAVISVIGSRTTKPDTICADSASNSINAMNKYGVMHLVCISGAGLGDNAGIIMTYIIRPLLLKNVYADALAQDALIQRSSLDWTIVRPYRLTDGQGTAHYKVAFAPFPSPLIIRSTTRADVADFMLKEVQTRNFSKKIAFISTRRV